MQTISNEPAPDESWRQIAPLLDAAMEKLGQKDHDALVLRFFENRNFKEVGAAQGASEGAAKIRVNRALEKLHRYFSQSGISSTTAIIAGEISANSIQMAPVALAKSVTAVAIAKGAAASGSTLALIKGTMKMMAWVKAKTAIVVGACVLVAGTTTVALCNLERPVRGIPANWSVISGDHEQWHWANGEISAHSTTSDSILASGNKYSNITLSAVASTTNREASLAIRMQDANNGYLIVFIPEGTLVNDRLGQISLVKKTAGNEVTLASYHGRMFSSLGQSAKIAVRHGPGIRDGGSLKRHQSVAGHGYDLPHRSHRSSNLR